MDRLVGYETQSITSNSDPMGSSSKYPKCDSKLRENDYRDALNVI